jgi:hypothetical protein
MARCHTGGPASSPFVSSLLARSCGMPRTSASGPRWRSLSGLIRAHRLDDAVRDVIRHHAHEAAGGIEERGTRLAVDVRTPHLHVERSRVPAHAEEEPNDAVTSEDRPAPRRARPAAVAVDDEVAGQHLDQALHVAVADRSEEAVGEPRGDRERLRGRTPRPFRYVDEGNLATIGRSKAVADVEGPPRQRLRRVGALASRPRRLPDRVREPAARPPVDDQLRDARRRRETHRGTK